MHLEYFKFAKTKIGFMTEWEDQDYKVYKNQIKITWTHDEPFADEGDSGALAVRATVTKVGQIEVEPFGIIR